MGLIAKVMLTSLHMTKNKVMIKYLGSQSYTSTGLVFSVFKSQKHASPSEMCFYDTIYLVLVDSLIGVGPWKWFFMFRMHDQVSAVHCIL